MAQIEVVFHPSMHVMPGRPQYDEAEMLPGYMERWERRWLAVVGSDAAHKRLQTLAQSVGDKLVQDGVDHDAVSPMLFSIADARNPDGFYFVMLQCRRFGKLLLTPELLEDENDRLVDFFHAILLRKAKRWQERKTIGSD